MDDRKLVVAEQHEEIWYFEFRKQSWMLDFVFLMRFLTYQPHSTAKENLMDLQEPW